MKVAISKVVVDISCNKQQKLNNLRCLLQESHSRRMYPELDCKFVSQLCIVWNYRVISMSCFVFLSADLKKSNVEVILKS